MAKIPKIGPDNGDNGEQEEDKPGHFNFPCTDTFKAAMQEYIAELEQPIGSSDGPLGKPSVAYTFTWLIADSVGYVLCDADRTSGRQKLSDEERLVVAASKNAAGRAELAAALAAYRVSLR